MGELRTTTGRQAAVTDLDVGENAAGETDHHAGNALVSNQHVRATTEHADRHLFVAAASHQSGQFIDRIGFGIESRDPTQLEPSSFRQRLLLSDDFFKAANQCHRKLTLPKRVEPTFLDQPPPVLLPVLAWHLVGSQSRLFIVTASFPASNSVRKLCHFHPDAQRWQVPLK